MSNPVKFCKIHSCEKYYSYSFQKYACRQCKRDYAANYRKNNPDKISKNNIEYARKRRDFVKQDKIVNPDKYKKGIIASEWCDIHSCNKVIGTDGLFICRKCKKEYAKKYREGNPLYRKHAKTRLLKKFNLTKKQYEKMISDCENKCHICKHPEKKIFYGRIVDLSIDHCHESESKGIIKIRGLLCHACNTSLGGFNDSIELLRRAITYLESHTHT